MGFIERLYKMQLDEDTYRKNNNSLRLYSLRKFSVFKNLIVLYSKTGNNKSLSNISFIYKIFGKKSIIFFQVKILQQWHLQGRKEEKQLCVWGDGEGQRRTGSCCPTATAWDLLTYESLLYFILICYWPKHLNWYPKRVSPSYPINNPKTILTLHWSNENWTEEILSYCLHLHCMYWQDSDIYKVILWEAFSKEFTFPFRFKAAVGNFW